MRPLGAVCPALAVGFSLLNVRAKTAKSRGLSASEYTKLMSERQLKVEQLEIWKQMVVKVLNY